MKEGSHKIVTPRICGSPMSMKLVSCMMAHLCIGIVGGMHQPAHEVESEESVWASNNNLPCNVRAHSCCVA